MRSHWHQSDCASGHESELGWRWLCSKAHDLLARGNNTDGTEERTLMHKPGCRAGALRASFILTASNTIHSGAPRLLLSTLLFLRLQPLYIHQLYTFKMTEETAPLRNQIKAAFNNVGLSKINNDILSKCKCHCCSNLVVFVLFPPLVWLMN